MSGLHGKSWVWPAVLRLQSIEEPLYSLFTIRNAFRRSLRALENQQPEDHRSRCLGVRGSGSFRAPFIFIDAADEEPQDHDYHTQQTNGGSEREHALAKRWIEKCQPAYSANHRQHAQPARQKA